ncbi:ADP-ribosylation factor GTPase-activating protein [Vigna angularis]|uniref:ADP-ribosylation factor GTPase-activating protein n=1 Tax=Phaseolus angularis TaxID=3914 RepID=A0A8T0LCL8_PHAAN|nr:ADP-ribosylation factor GTPase-activating protein [Vigna angularis]
MALNGVNLRQEKNSHDNVKDKFIQQIDKDKFIFDREFTHRVKSVSMAKFSPEEVSALQAGGNERANQVDLKEWDALRNSKPDSKYPHKVFASSNIQKLREFIKYVYVERRYTGESSSNLSRIRLSEKEPNASKRSSSFRLEFRTPNSSPGPYPKSDDKNLRYLYDESRSPRYAQKYSRNGGHIRSPIQIEVVDDMYKDDERRNRRLANIEAKLKKTSSDDLKKVETVAAPLAEVSKETTPVEKPSRKTESIGAFQKLPIVMTSIDILGSALRKARKLSPTKGIANNSKREKNKEIVFPLRTYVESFPNKTYLHPYERSLIKLTLGDGYYEMVC